MSSHIGLGLLRMILRNCSEISVHVTWVLFHPRFSTALTNISFTFFGGTQSPCTLSSQLHHSAPREVVNHGATRREIPDWLRPDVAGTDPPLRGSRISTSTASPSWGMLQIPHHVRSWPALQLLLMMPCSFASEQVYMALWSTPVIHCSHSAGSPRPSEIIKYIFYNNKYGTDPGLRPEK